MTEHQPKAPALPSLGEILHRARIAGGEQRPRPWPPESWEDRDPRLKALDEAMAQAVAAAVRAEHETRAADADAVVQLLTARRDAAEANLAAIGPELTADTYMAEDIGAIIGGEDGTSRG